MIKQHSPVVSKGLIIFCIQRTSRGKHDGGVQISDDARHCAGCCDAGLCALVACLES